MLRHHRPARKHFGRAAAHRAGADMALASTIVFFGVFPAVLATGLVLVQAIATFAP